jgi:hypothetical protein
MGSPPDIASWTQVGESTNANFFEIEPRVLAVVAKERMADDGQTALENVGVHKRYFRESGRGVIIGFTDGGTSQNRDAREVYQKQLDSTVLLGVTIIGGTALSRAFASFFIGFTRPQVPFKLSKDFDDAITWARTLLSADAE